MRVTIISDASHCGQSFVVGYGFWAVSLRGSHAGSGSFKSTMKDASIAETMAIVNALHCSVRLGIVDSEDEVLIQTDCLNAISFLEERAGKKRTDIKPVVAAFKDIKKSKSLNIEFRHVRGHTNVMDRRSKAQRLANERARAAMKKARRQKCTQPIDADIQTR
jgi:ribonuclease HI